MRKETVLALLALGLANFMVAQDLAALNVSLPSIERDLNVDLSTAQWIVNAYLLVFGMTIVAGGRLADELGRRRILLTGVALFAVTSFLGALAPEASWLIGARALMGIGSGLIVPTVAGMSYAVLPSDRAELAGGISVGSYGLGMAIGPMVGGALTEFLGWRWIQYVNLPLATLVFFGVWLTIRLESPGERPRIDYPGIATLSLGLVALLFALDQGTDWGWSDWRILLSFALAIAFIVSFIAIERRSGEHALIPGEILRIPGVAVPCVLRALMGPAYSAAVLFLPQIMQKLFGYSPFTTGIGMLPMLGTYAVVSFLVGIVAARLNERIAIIVGMACLALGPYLLSRFSIDVGYFGLVLGMVIMGFGLALFQPASNTAAVRADHRGRKSLASGLVLMFQFVGGAIGLGLTTTVVASSERAGVDRHLASIGAAVSPVERSALNSLLAGAETAQQVVQKFGPVEAQQLLQVASDAFADGVRAGFLLDAGLATAGVVLALYFLNRARREGADHEAALQPGLPSAS
jgi:EmrB/QacA subfamily drug resistance transporter